MLKMLLVFITFLSLCYSSKHVPSILVSEINGGPSFYTLSQTAHHLCQNTGRAVSLRCSDNIFPHVTLSALNRSPLSLSLSFLCSPHSRSQCLREKSPVLRRGRGRAPNISVPSVAPGASRAFILAAMCSKSAQPTRSLLLPSP